MEKTGEVKVGRTPCSACHRVSTQSEGKRVLCKRHAVEKAALHKRGAATQNLKSFTTPIGE